MIQDSRDFTTFVFEAFVDGERAVQIGVLIELVVAVEDAVNLAAAQDVAGEAPREIG